MLGAGGRRGILSARALQSPQLLQLSGNAASLLIGEKGAALVSQ
jgi:hypothetical protein